MNKIRFFVLSTLVVVLLLFCLLIGVIHLYSTRANGSLHLAETYFSKLATPYHFGSVQLEGRQLRYIQTGQSDPAYPLIVFVHGAPGSWEAFKAFLADVDLKEKAQLISVDRFGYGGSDHGQPVIDIATHAAGINEVIKAHPASKVVLVGHSYGGPVIGMVAATYPEQVDGLLMVAPVNDPNSEPVKWYAHLCHWSFSRALLPDYVNVCTTEKMNHIQALKNIEPDWSRITAPVIHYHGQKDILAPHDGNVQFSQKKLSPPQLTVKSDPKKGHFILWEKMGTVKELILQLL